MNSRHSGPCLYSYSFSSRLAQLPGQPPAAQEQTPFRRAWQDGTRRQSPAN